MSCSQARRVIRQLLRQKLRQELRQDLRRRPSQNGSGRETILSEARGINYLASIKMSE